MQPGERFSLLLKIFLLFLTLFALNPAPASRAVSDAEREARIAQGEERNQSAAQALRSVLEREPWRAALWEEVARQEYAAGRLEEAVAALRQAETAGSISPDGRFLLAEAYLQQGDDTAAEAALREMLRVEDPFPRAYERLAQLQRERGDLPAAIETLRAWRKFDGQNPHVAYLLGLCLSAVDPDQALPLLLEASKNDSSFTPTVQTLRRGLGLAANTVDPAYGWMMIGRSLGSVEQWDLAVEAFRQAVDISPEYAEAWGFLGEARYQIDGSGKEELERALELDPKSSVVRALLALFWRREGDPERALDYLEQIAREEPDEPVWQVEIGNTLVETGNLLAAREYFQKAVDLEPDNPVYWQYLAQFSVEYNMEPRTLGLPAARQAVLLAPDNPAALDTMGWTLAKLGDAASAERFLQRAVEKDATYAPAHLHLGQLYLQQNRAQAYPYLKRAAALAGETPVGTVARRLLEQYYGEGG